ncbi:hypothetical protein FRC01_005875 [Tulasnella sp. 417]|nr:hypothetical protein FRC01_005875 [Tulasnella sp. 417]
MADSRTSQLNQRIVALANDAPQPSRPSVAIQLSPGDSRISLESGITYVGCNDWRSSPPPAYTAASPPHYSEPSQTARPQKPTSAFGRKLAGFFAPNEADDTLDNLVGDFIHPKKPKHDPTNPAAGSPLEIAVEVVQEEWTTGSRNGNNTRRASRFGFGARDRSSEPAAQSS